MLENNLKEIREEQGMSQLELSYDTRISPADISRIEKGMRFPYKGWREKICKVLKVSEEEIFPEVSG